jgi:hypothetical protein
VGGAGPLAIDDFMEVVGVPDVGGLQLLVSFKGSLLLDKARGKAYISKTCKRQLRENP